MLYKLQNLSKTIILGATVFLISLVFYYFLFRNFVHSEDSSPMSNLIGALFRAGILTILFIAFHLTLIWLRDRPQHHLSASNIAVVIIILLLILILVRYVDVARALDSPWIPQYAIDYSRRPILMQGAGVMVAAGFALFFRLKKKPLAIVICAMAAMAYYYLFPALHAFYDVFLQSDGVWLLASFIMELRNRRWYEWIMIVLGVIGIIGQTIALITPKFGPFNWIQLLVSAIFLWGGTIPRKKSKPAA